MFKIISHRGNLLGKSLDENKPSYIENAIAKGFDVEVDVWSVGNDLYTGHDVYKYKIDIKFLKNPKLWCHAKNVESLIIMMKNNIHTFWHETDRYTITNRGIPWCYPGNYINSGITVELSIKKDIPLCLGVCTDYPVEWKKLKKGST
jgi:hypothetical protein